MVHNSKTKCSLKIIVMHYIIILLVVAVILYFQLRFFINTKKRVNVFKSIFPDGDDSYVFESERLRKAINSADESELIRMLNNSGANVRSFYDLVQFPENNEDIQFFNVGRARNYLLNKVVPTTEISTDYQNPILKDIFVAINGYLKNNKAAVSDFHLIKDIVDRNCDAADDEISTQIPFPLYLGLTGTMFGIIIGVGYLWLSGDLVGLLSMGSVNSGTNGIVTLLGGVALAMIASAFGIILTVRGSAIFKDARFATEHNKHVFLSWIQTNLLPTLNNDAAQTLEKMSRNLVEFNNSFADNTQKLGSALSKVNETTKLQKQLLSAVNSLADKDISQQNIKLLKALNDSAENVGLLAEHLNQSANYLQKVKELNEKLDKGERRAVAVEKMAEFFENETTQIDQRKLAMSHAVGVIDSELEEHLRKLTEHSEKYVKEFSLALGRQQDALQKKLDETSVVIEEIRNLKSIKSSIEKFEKAASLQNSKLDNLANAIRQLAQAKVSGANDIKTLDDSTQNKSKKNFNTAVLVFSGILVLLFIIANWDYIYAIIYDIFSL